MSSVSHGVARWTRPKPLDYTAAMAYQVILSNDVPWGDESCRLLELRADTREELDVLRAAARAKKWFDWLLPCERREGGWGAVMEKGMPDSAGFSDALGLLETAELQDLC